MLRETTIRAENERKYINTLNNIHKQQIKNKMHKMHEMHKMHKMHEMRKNRTNSNIYFYIMIKTIVYYIHAYDAIIYVYNKLISIINYLIGNHVLNIAYFDTTTNKNVTCIPYLYLLNYYKPALRPNEIYYSITLWSKQHNKYISVYIDDVILRKSIAHNQQNLHNQYTISNILNLLKYANAVESIEISFIDKPLISTDCNLIYKKYEALNNIDTLYTLDTYKLNPYFTSFAIPNNVSVKALQLLYTYLYNFDIINKNNTIIHLIHKNGYITCFDISNDIIFSSLDVNELD